MTVRRAACPVVSRGTDSESPQEESGRDVKDGARRAGARRQDPIRREETAWTRPEISLQEDPRNWVLTVVSLRKASRRPRIREALRDSRRHRARALEVASVRASSFRCSLGEPVEQRSRDRRDRPHPPPPADRLDEILGRSVLQRIDGAGTERTRTRILEVECREDHNVSGLSTPPR